MECLEIALQAPTGSNRQGWQWVFVDGRGQEARDRATSTTPTSSSIARCRARRYDAGDPRAERADTRRRLGRLPVRELPSRAGAARSRASAGKPADGIGGRRLVLGIVCCPPCGASCWRCASAASARRGPRCTFPTAASSRPPNCSASRTSEYSQAGLFPIAYTKGTDFKPAKRLPAAERHALGRVVIGRVRRIG